MIAIARQARRLLQKGRQAADRSRSRKASGTAAQGIVSRSAKARRIAELRERRERFFARPIEYIPCREFLKKNAAAAASTPPADAAVPLDRDAADRAAGKALTPYLASLYQTRLLTKDEEQYYFRRMNWLKFHAATARGRLDKRRATERQMAEVEGWLAEAETVKSIIITSNLRLVVSIAKKFVDASNSFEELVSDGNVALMRAVEKFNFALGNRFSTYATYAIQRHFFRMSHKGRQQRNRFVTSDEALRDRAADTSESPYCSSEQIGTLKTLFAGFLGDLEPRERQIVVARFGFDGKPPRTFRELGSSMGVCKERIRQIQTRAMDKLREMAAEARLEQTVGDWL